MLPETFRRAALSLALSLALLLAASIVSAQTTTPYAGIDTTLAGWDGPKQVVLRSDLVDPLASPLIQDLIERFLQSGFRVSLAAAQDPPGDGLVADVRLTAETSALILSRAADLSVLSLHRWGERIQQPAEDHPAPSPGDSSARQPPARPSESGGLGRPTTGSPPKLWDSLPKGPLQLEEKPRGLTLVGQSAAQLQLAFLLDDRLQLARLSVSGLAESVHHRLSETPTRGLHIASGDLNGDGHMEVAGVWAEDIQGVYDGVDSRLHSWIFQARDDRLEPRTEDLKAYLRVVGATAYLQGRSDYTPFGGPVVPLAATGESFVALGLPAAWGQRDLFDLTPLGTTHGLTRDTKNRLRLVALEGGQNVPGSLLLEGLGTFSGPRVAVRLENPEYRSGFEKEDRITERYFSLMPRIVVANDQTTFTILRGREMGLPLIGAPKGKDAVVRVARDGETLGLERPFDPVDAFILDFALLQSPGHPLAAVLLLNDKDDGSGTAHLLFQRAK